LAERISKTRRIELQNVAEREIMRHKDDHALWHKHIHNVDLDAVQVLKMEEMDEQSNTIDFSTRRGGKTAVKEMYLLEHNAKNADQELGIVAPREAQSITNLNYHLDAIRRSEILTAYISHKSSRKQMSDTRYEFANRSKAQAYGIMAQVDGGDMTVASLEEVDDMPKDRLYSRFLLMMGSARRLGASKNSINSAQVRVTGVFKGADTLTDMMETGTYHALGCLRGKLARDQIKKLIREGYLQADAVDIENYKYPVPILNSVNGIALGFLNETTIKDIAAGLSDDEVARQLLCINTTSKNLVWEIYMRYAMQMSIKASIEIVEPVPGQKYKKRGFLSMGYDHSGHGETPEASKSALVINEEISGFYCRIFAKTWPAGTDEKIIKNDLIAYWKYFNPDTAHGDAYGIGLLTIVNDELYAEGLTTIDRHTVGDGQSTASNWSGWAFAPLRFEGMTKHSMAEAVKQSYHNKRAVMPYLDDVQGDDQAVNDMRLLAKQTLNIKPEQSKVSYSTYKMINKKLGDDLFDADMAAQWGHLTQGADIIPGVIVTSSNTQAQLLQRPLPKPVRYRGSANA